jgi:hypothetical protein
MVENIHWMEFIFLVWTMCGILRGRMKTLLAESPYSELSEMLNTSMVL